MISRAITRAISRPFAGLAAAALATALLGACASAPSIRSYVLTPTAPPPAQAAAKPLTLVIRDLRLPLYLDRPQIVSRDDRHRVLVADDERWAGDLRQDLMRVLGENLGRILASERIVTAPHQLRLDPDFRLEVEILGFERELGGPVSLRARWWLAAGADGRVVANRLATLRGEALAPDAPHAAVVASMSRIWGDFATIIAAELGNAEGNRR